MSYFTAQKLSNYKTANYQILKQSLNKLSTVTKLPNPTMHQSPSTGFRMRAEFIFKIINKYPVFMMTEENPITKIKTSIPIDIYSYGHPFITEAMQLLKKQLLVHKNLMHKLFAVEFLVSSCKEVLISLIYHKKLDEIWLNYAWLLKEELNKSNKNLSFDIIGRAKNQKIVLDKDYVTEKFYVNNKIYQMIHTENSFTQPNYYMNTKMLNWAVENTKNIGGDLLELYCGNGNFSIPLSSNFDNVIATEISSTSVNSAQINLKNNNITNTKIIRLSAEEFTSAMNNERNFNRLKESNVNLNSYNISTVLVDPPRAGLDNNTIKLISNFNNIIYISCGIDSLTENLKTLTKTHKLEKLAFFDQFPFTGHIETGCILKKNNS